MEILVTVEIEIFVYGEIVWKEGSVWKTLQAIFLFLRMFTWIKLFHLYTEDQTLKRKMSVKVEIL